jgi:hypothetical protein
VRRKAHNQFLTGLDIPRAAWSARPGRWLVELYSETGSTERDDSVMFSNSKSLRVALVALLAAGLLAGGLALAKKPENPGKPKPDPEPPPPPPVTYEITWLGTLGGASSGLEDMNDLGDAVGNADPPNGWHRAFLNELQPDGSRLMIDLHTMLCASFPEVLSTITDPCFSNANAINNVGQVVGVMRNTDPERVLFRYTPGPDPNLEIFMELSDDSQARDINNAGTFVGNERGADGEYYAYRYADHLEFLDDLIDPASGWHLRVSYAINDAGQIVGDGVLNGVEYCPFLFLPAADGDTYATVVDLGAETGRARDISEVGHVTCRAGFLYTPWDGMIDLAPGRKEDAAPFGVNELGHVVGYYTAFKEEAAMCLALPPTYEFLKLDDLLDPVANDPDDLARWYASFVLLEFTWMNNPLPGEAFGQNGGTTLLDGIDEAYILTPVPPEE